MHRFPPSRSQNLVGTFGNGISKNIWTANSLQNCLQNHSSAVKLLGDQDSSAASNIHLDAFGIVSDLTTAEQ